ncbi:MAG: cytochrome oxidase [Myxococcales bacterium]|nr:MAG: cytochrome oxidase [Myxococcales bacterium]
MEVLTLLIFLSLTLVAMAVAFYVWTILQHTHEHSERMALLPLEDDESPERFANANVKQEYSKE